MWFRFALSTGLLAASTAVSAAALARQADTPLSSNLLVSVPDLAAESDGLARQVAATSDLLTEMGIDGIVTSRLKSPYSVWMKMTRKGVTMDQVYDRLAMRVRVDTIDDCYALIQELHSRYSTVPGEFDDYIAHPKPNGYASIHTVLQLPEGPIEVQVRTHAMHEAAEHGSASHAAYKRGQGFDQAA